MPEFAPIVALVFLGLGGVALAALLVLVFAAATRRRRLLFGTVAGAGLIGIAYGGTLLALSALSRDVLLRAGDQKYFCEVDCHLAYSVLSVRRSQTLGRPPLSPRSGEFLVVTLRTWFDERSISSFRGNAPLTPNPREAWLIDASGRRHPRCAAAERALAAAGGASTPLDRPLRPGQDYTTQVVFDVAPGLRGTRLLLADPPGLEFALLGHENSPLHGKLYFDLGAGFGPERP